MRGLIAEHGPVLGVELSPDSQAAGRWALTSGCEYLAAGVGTGILGFRADERQPAPAGLTQVGGGVAGLADAGAAKPRALLGPWSSWRICPFAGSSAVTRVEVRALSDAGMSPPRPAR